MGLTKLRQSTPEVSYKELIFEAAENAYADASVDPRRDVESFVCSSEDFLEGTSIFDEYVPDQLGAVLKPVCTICADGLYSLATAYMQILTGLFDIVAVEAHNKASDITNLPSVYDLALDPVYVRPLGMSHQFIAGMEMNRYLHVSGATIEDSAKVVAKNHRNAHLNPVSMKREPTDGGASEFVSYPLRRNDIAPIADGAAVVVLAAEESARGLRGDPIWIEGASWSSDSPTLETRDWDKATYARLAAKKAYSMAKIGNPTRDIQIAEVDDTYAYKELQHVEALGLCGPGKAHELLAQGVFDPRGELPVNPSGGSLGMGHTLEMSGLLRVIELVKQLRGDAGQNQVKGVQKGIAQAWRGIPTASGAVMVLGNA